MKKPVEKNSPNIPEKEKVFHEKKLIRQPVFMVFAVFVLLMLLFAYKDHFHNPFQFDDAHTIENNNAIRSLKNIPEFFKDASTFSSLPANQIYRPGVTTLNAIDYWIGGKVEPDPFYFHVSIFLSYVLLGILLFFFFKKLFNDVKPSQWNKYFALFGAGLYCLHAANAETINYIIARSDSFSTLMIVLAFVIYQYFPRLRKTYLYILPVIIGFFVKEPTIMFAPLLLLYILFFEKKLSLPQFFYGAGFLTAVSTFWRIALLFFVSLLLFILSKKMAAVTFTTGGTSALAYILTQPFVILHYVLNFILPINLTADTDWKTVSDFSDSRIYIGFAFMFVLIVTAIHCSKKDMLRPISFGIIWFLLALLPTSIIPLAEVMNDHRTFFPYIGLVISAVWMLARIFATYENQIRNSSLLMGMSIALPVIVLLGHTYGTIKRTEVWSSGENLWYDVTLKSPDNPRGLMNYANAEMALGKLDTALNYYERAQKISPNYSYLHINLGILKNLMGNTTEAEQHFKTAISLDAFNPESYYYYCSFLISHARYTEADAILINGLRVSPEHSGMKILREQLNKILADQNNVLPNAIQNAQQHPSPENYLSLSLIYYQHKRYEDCITASQEALKLNPDYADAYNNICSAWNVLGNFDEAIKAGQSAIDINPNNQLARNNLNVSLRGKMVTDSIKEVAKKNPSADTYVSLSLIYYNYGAYQKCVESATTALIYKPNSIEAYNNICSGYNMLEEWDKAIDAAEKGLKINPDYELLKNNLRAAQLGKAAVH
ncbi:hypothetical protein BH09BAC5_BH09BAC5_08800 [soil metagenome]